MPTYVSPSPTPTPVSASRSSSPAPSESISNAGPRRRSRRPSPNDSVDSPEESLLKTSLIFIGSILAATLCAHKFWPKGVTYGDKEEWEIEKIKKVKKHLQDEKMRARRDERGPGYGDRRYDGGGRDDRYDRDRNERRARYRDGAAASAAAAAAAGYTADRHYRREQSSGVTSRSRSGSRSRRRSGSRDRERYYDAGARDGPVLIERRARRETTSAYYPPASSRFPPAIDRSGSTASSGSRRSSRDSGGRRQTYYDRDDGSRLSRAPEKDYVYRSSSARRRSAVDAPDRGYDDIPRERRRRSRDAYSDY